MATARPLAIIDELLATVDYLRISVGEAARDPDRWMPCAPLVTDEAALAALVATTTSERGTDRDDVATSLFVQGYAFRIATAAIGAWLLSGSTLDVAPDDVAIAMGRGRPNAVDLAVAATSPAGAPIADVHAHLIDGHLAPLVDNAHRSCRVGAALLWGNVAASCASAFGAVAGALPARRVEIRDRAEEFFATARPEVRDGGRLVRVGQQFAWERRSCCLWYKTESAWLCEDCSLRPASDHEARYAAMRRDVMDAGT
ncbi:MAG: IucA/IucC family C-terminal-domain containing protein [Ilumatobacteraceae bacterium]